MRRLLCRFRLWAAFRLLGREGLAVNLVFEGVPMIWSPGRQLHVYRCIFRAGPEPRVFVATPEDWMLAKAAGIEDTPLSPAAKPKSGEGR